MVNGVVITVLEQAEQVARRADPGPYLPLNEGA